MRRTNNKKKFVLKSESQKRERKMEKQKVVIFNNPGKQIV